MYTSIPVRFLQDLSFIAQISVIYQRKSKKKAKNPGNYQLFSNTKIVENTT